MSWQTDINKLVASLTAKVNAIGTNAKTTDELPPQINLDPASRIRVSRDGISERIDVAQIIDAVSSGSYDQLISIGELELVDNIITVPANAQWKISEVYYGNIAEIEITIPYCATGLERKDILVANTSNNIIRVPGTETDGITFRPNIPINTVLVTEIDVTDSTVGEPSTPVTGQNYVEKIESSETIISGAPTLITLSTTNSSLRFVGTTTLISGIVLGNNYRQYPGKKLTIKNFQEGTDIIISHLGSTLLNRKQLWFPNEEDFTLKPGQVIEFSLSLRSNRFEFIGLITDLSDYYNKSEIDTKLSSVLVYKGSVANYAALPSTGLAVGHVYNLTDTGHNYAWTGSVWDDLGPAVDISGKEDSVNKVTTMTGNTTSNIVFLTAKATYDWAVGLFEKKLGVVASGNISGTFVLDHNNKFFNTKTMTATTTFSDSNLAVDGVARGMYLTGNYGFTFPAYWIPDVDSDLFDGTRLNRITWDVLNAGSGTEVIRYTIKIIT